MIFSVVGIGTACSGDDEQGDTGPSTGGSNFGTGGAAGGGSGGTNAGGSAGAGAPSTGGTSAGSGGVSATGGTMGAGGGPSSGGFVSTGGAPSGGGASSGGAASASGETGRMVGMTAAHNAVRSGVQTSNPIPPVSWSTDVAAIAQAYAEQLAAQGCGLVHSGRDGYGENLAYIGGGTDTAQRAVELWASEGECYDFGQFLRTDTCTCQCQGNNCCGHYTQLVWRGTTRIGCGVASCSRGGSVWVCNYTPPGNYIGQNPY